MKLHEIKGLSGWALLNKIAKERGEFGFATMAEDDMAKLIDIKAADKFAEDLHGEFGFASLKVAEMRAILDAHPELVKAKADIPRGHDGRALRGLAREIALQQKKADKTWKEYDIKDDMIGTARKIKEEALETQNIEDLWAENKDSASWYANSTQYQVRQIKDSSPAKYEAFSIVGDQRKPFGKFTVDELKSTLEPMRADQKPDAEGFTTYVDPEKVEAFQYSGDPMKVMMDKIGARLNNGDYVVRSNDGNDFKYAIEKPATFEATLTKVK